MNFLLSQDDLVKTLDNSNTFYFVLNQNLQLLYINKSAKETILKAEEDANEITLYDIFSVSNKILIDTHIIPLLEIRGAFEEVAVEIKTKTGNLIPSVLNGKKMALKENFYVYVLSASKFSQRKLYEKELIFQKNRAEDLVKKLEDLNSRLEKITYSLIHDFKAPVNNIIGLIDLIDIDNNISIDELSYYLDLIKKSAYNLNLMIRDVLNQKINKSISKSVVNLNEIIEKVLKLMTIKITESHAKIEVSKLPIVYGDPSLLIRVFQNLIDNAIKFKKINERPEIKIFAECSDSFANIYIQDNGQGIEEEELLNIFNFGGRARNTSDIEGSGIGLNFCKSALEEMGGELKVDSIIGVGSKFFFNLPLVE
ncbi:sensor histidine kinase [Schleiferia thermophila]|jgi:signal transduction histidine kinase|uniref:sensor histidine kinase n=1 Tax=Schleiferia thermophila TaxID=884107 RepID=UPI002FD8C7E4